MDLPSREARDFFEINSWERAIVWSALILRSSNVSYANDIGNENYPHKNAVRLTLGRAIVDGALTATLRIEATIPYDSPYALAQGGDFILAIQDFYAGPPEVYDGEHCSVLTAEGFKTTPAGTGLEEEPSHVDTLEKYFIWACWQAELSLLSPLPSQLLPITVDFFEESQPSATIKVVANIPIDYEAYKDCENFVCSVLPLSSQISPAGLRSFSWDEITGKPTFSDVAFSGNYEALNNTPSIPSSLEQFARFNELVRSINNTAPDPQTGNVDLTLNVGSVYWLNITGKPNFSGVAFSGDYNDLTNTPSIPILTWGNITGKPNFSDVATSGDYADLTNTPSIPVLEWSGISNKPTWATVAFSGSYNDLLDKPDVSGGGGSASGLLGKKLLIGDTALSLPFQFDGDLQGIFNWVGTNQGSEAFSTANLSGLIFTDFWASFSTDYRTVDQLLSGNTILNYNKPSTVDFVNFTVSLTRFSLYGRLQNASYEATFNIEGSNDNTNWEVLGTFNINGNVIQWHHCDCVSNSFYQQIRFINTSFVGGFSSSSVETYEVEFYGEVLLNNIPDGSQIYNLKLSDLGYLLEPSTAIGTIQLLPANTPGLNVGDRFYVHNPHPFNVQGIPASGDNFVSSNNLTILSQGQTAEVVKVNETSWFAF
ncbi:MAG: hypothetical protein AB4063_20835 [Crocosphaera sp.]